MRRAHRTYSLFVPMLTVLLCAAASADSVWMTQDSWQTTTSGDKIVDVDITNVEFSFDQIPTGAYLGPGGNWAMSLVTGLGPVQVNVSRPGSWLQIVDTSPYAEVVYGPGGVPDDWGAHVLSPFADYTNPAEILFEVILAPGMGWVGAHIDVGDFGGSDLDEVHFGGEPAFLTNPPGSDPNEFFAIEMHSIPGSAIGFVSLYASAGAPGFEQSAFWDNLVLQVVAEDDLPTSVVAPAVAGSPDPTGGPGYFPGQAPLTSPIPEPGTGLLLIAGGALIVLVRRRRKN
jgi:PEP-CTERM motif